MEAFAKKKKTTKILVYLNKADAFTPRTNYLTIMKADVFNAICGLFEFLAS